MTMINLEEIQRQTYREDIQGLNVHDHLKGKSVDELKMISMSDRFPFAVCCLSLTGDGNVGGIVRSSVCHGAEEVIVFGRRKFDRRSTVGSLNYINHSIIYGFEDDNVGEFDVIKFYREIILERLYYPVFIEQGGIPIQDYDWEIPNLSPNDGRKICIVVGNETNGIPDKMLDFFKEFPVVTIPQRGVIRSLNVSNAMNIAAWSLRMRKGWF